MQEKTALKFKSAPSSEKRLGKYVMDTESVVKDLEPIERDAVLRACLSINAVLCLKAGFDLKPF